MIPPPPIFTLRNYQKRDFERLFKLDSLCFQPGIAYSRAELSSFIEQRRATTIVAEWNTAEWNEAERSVAEGKVAEGKTAAEIAAKAGTGGKRAKAPSGSPSEQQLAASHPAIAGFVTFHLQRQGYGHIITLDVHPEARRHGLGTLLMHAVFERLRKMAAFMVVLEVAVNNHGALAFYEKLGFHRIRVLEGYYSRDVDAILMTRRI
jgi:ribosomal-protein-alanine N-acetyltransferase